MPTASQTPAPAVAGTQIPATGGLSFEALQVQLQAQTQQLAVVQAQRDVIQRQLDVTSPGPSTQGLVTQRAALDNDILRLQMDIAGTKAQIGSRLGIPADRVGANGRPIIVNRPDYGQRRGPDPDAIVGMSFAFVIAVSFPLAIAYARRIWRGKPAATATQADTIAPRLARLEQAAEAIAIEVERV